MSIERITHKQHLSQMLEEVSELDDELSYRRTLARMRNSGSVVRSTKRIIEHHTEGQFAFLSMSPSTIY